MLAENWARFLNCKSLWITVRNEQRLNSIFTVISSTVTRKSMQIDYSFLFPKFPSVHAVRGIPGRRHLFFQFWNFPPNHIIYFARDNCRHNGWKICANNFCCVHHVWPKNWYQRTVLLWCTARMEPPSWKEPSSLFTRFALMPTVSAGVPKLKLILLPTDLPKQIPVKEIQILSLLIDWPPISTHYTSRRECVFNKTWNIFYPDLICWFWTNI